MMDAILGIFALLIVLGGLWMLFDGVSDLNKKQTAAQQYEILQTNMATDFFVRFYSYWVNYRPLYRVLEQKVQPSLLPFIFSTYDIS